MEQINILVQHGLSNSEAATKGSKRLDLEPQALMVSDAEEMSSIIRQNLSAFDECGSVLAATYRRTERLWETYLGPGCAFFIVKEPKSGHILGGAGLGPLAGLPHTEGYGEIRDLVVNQDSRSLGLGRKLLEKCILAAKSFDYSCIYLKTTPKMEQARKLFEIHGFKAVRHSNDSEKGLSIKIPCYYLLTLKAPAKDLLDPYE